jgi:hypothetical protein
MRRTRRNAPRFALENPVGYTDDESFAAVDHFDKVRADLFADRALLNRKASVRLDIPSSKPVNKGGRDTVVVTVHEPSSAKRVIGYDHTAVVKGALFQVTPAAARDIALGIMNKTPFSYVTGKLVGAGIEGQRAEAVGIPVYYDPRVVHLYVDARNGLPIKAAREVNFRYVKGNDDYYLPEIEGIYIWAVDPVYYAPGKAPGSVLGAKYGNTAPGAWDWAMTTPFALTGTPAKVVMPEGRENPAALTCPKCGGTGKIESFMHIEDGDCFRCGGTGKVDKLTPTERGMIAPPPSVGSYAVVWVHGDEAGSVNTGAPSTSFEEANWLKNRLKKEHIGTDYYVVKFDGSEWRNRQGQAFPWTTPEGRRNPDDDAHVRFVYGARRLARGGFAPVVTQHGPGGSAHEHGGWTGRGYDEDVALAVAKEHAEELASQYVGDWNIEVVSAEDEQLEHGAERAAWQARHEEGRANPGLTRAQTEALIEEMRRGHQPTDDEVEGLAEWFSRTSTYGDPDNERWLLEAFERQLSRYFVGYAEDYRRARIGDIFRRALELSNEKIARERRLYEIRRARDY